jgi:hypothetical protein
MGYEPDLRAIPGIDPRAEWEVSQQGLRLVAASGNEILLGSSGSDDVGGPQSLYMLAQQAFDDFAKRGVKYKDGARDPIAAALCRISQRTIWAARFHATRQYRG